MRHLLARFALLGLVCLLATVAQAKDPDTAKAEKTKKATLASILLKEDPQFSGRSHGFRARRGRG